MILEIIPTLISKVLNDEGKHILKCHTYLSFLQMNTEMPLLDLPHIHEKQILLGKKNSELYIISICERIKNHLMQ